MESYDYGPLKLRVQSQIPNRPFHNYDPHHHPSIDFFEVHKICLILKLVKRLVGTAPWQVYSYEFQINLTGQPIIEEVHR